MSNAAGQIVLSQETLNTHFAEAFRALRANISFSSIDRPLKSILVTSAWPNEGKTTTVINLGIILAQAGPRVIIVDADFRRPSLHHVFGFIPNGKKTPPGLSNLIVGSAQMEDAMIPSGFGRLTLVPAGTIPPNPNELLSSQRMKAVLAALAEQADFVLLDSSPCLLYSDAFVLAPVTDGVLYIVRAGSHDPEAQRRVQRQLQQAKAHMLGVVFNGAQVEDSGTYYYDGNRRGQKTARRR